VWIEEFWRAKRNHADNAILFAVGAMSFGKPGEDVKNFWTNDSGKIVRCGAPAIWVPSEAYEAVVRKYPRPYHLPGSGDDVAFTTRAVECGCELVPVENIKSRHWPEWREALEFVWPPERGEENETIEAN